MAVASVVVSLGLVSVSADFMNCNNNPVIISSVQFKLLFGWTRISNNLNPHHLLLLFTMTFIEWMIGRPQHRLMDKLMVSISIEPSWINIYRLVIIQSDLDGWLAGRSSGTEWLHIHYKQHSSHSCINGSGEWREECRLLWLCAVMKPSDMTGSVYSGNCKRNKQTEIDSSPGGLSIPLATGRLILVGVWCRCTQRTSTTTGSSSYDWPPPSPSTSRKDK